MSEDNTTVVVVETTENAKTRGPNGELGVATPALTLKQRWHTEHFKLVDTSDNAHRNRQSYVAKPDALSLKQFARKLAKSGDTCAETWFANKAGENNKERSEANARAATAAAGATKMGRKKSKSGSGKAKVTEVTL